MSLVLQSSGGGAVTLQEPATASNLTVSIPAVTGTIITSADSATVTPTMLSQKLVQMTAQASTSGTAIDFLGIPSWARLITVLFSNVTSSVDVQVCLGTSAGPETTGYSGGYSTVFGNDQNNSTSITTGFTFPSANGMMTIANVTGATWVASYSGWYGSGSYIAGGSKTLSTGSPAGLLTQVRVRTSGTFTSGSVNIMYE